MPVIARYLVGGHMCWHSFNAFIFEAIHWAAFGNRSSLPQLCRLLMASVVANITIELPDRLQLTAAHTAAPHAFVKMH